MNIIMEAMKLLHDGLDKVTGRAEAIETKLAEVETDAQAALSKFDDLAARVAALEGELDPSALSAMLAAMKGSAAPAVDSTPVAPIVTNPTPTTTVTVDPAAGTTTHVDTATGVTTTIDHAAGTASASDASGAPVAADPTVVSTAVTAASNAGVAAPAAAA